MTKVNEEIQRKEKPFDSFKLGFQILVLAGFYRPLNKPKNRLKIMSFEVYRLLTCFILVIYNLLHIIYIIQVKNDSGARLECVMTEIPQINVLFKFLTISWQSSNIDRIHDILNDPLFAANGKRDEELLRKNRIEMWRLVRVINTCVTLAGISWTMSHIMRKIHDENAVVPLYMPFETDTWPKFVLASLIPVIPILWVGYAHLTLDALVATYYAQAYVQLKIITFNLERIFNTRDDADYFRTHDELQFQYRDVADTPMENRFVYCVKRYEKVVWYTNEVSRVFNPFMSFQFFTSSAAMCTVIYKMSVTEILSVPFIFLFLLIVVLLIQVFIYCYYGNLVTYESQTVNTALYLSDWHYLSPRFRRQLLIAMSRWSRPLTAHVAGIIPLSLNTFVSILRFSYSLFTMLTTKHVAAEPLEHISET